MAEEKKCTGRCELCTPNQRTYCAAQKMYYIEQDLIEIKALLRQGNTDVVTLVNKELIIEEE